ncbi:hypothetical protein ACH5RR_039077 [Cinchona calisaya]|uniref:Uncharacterized protein n=1 Tax=Cinchona calisaya TaxID=153742 RepID=A0ABD2Y2P7_9GENT
MVFGGYFCGFQLKDPSKHDKYMVVVVVVGAFWEVRGGRGKGEAEEVGWDRGGGGAGDEGGDKRVEMEAEVETRGKKREAEMEFEPSTLSLSKRLLANCASTTLTTKVATLKHI